MKYTKFIAPLALTIILPFSSCSTHGKDVAIPRLNRVNYKSVRTFTDLNGVFKKIRDKQMYNEDDEPDFTIFDKGTVNVKYKVKLTGSIEVDSYKAPKVLNNLDILLTDNITISWDGSGDTRYIKIATSNGSQYIGKEGEEWYRYYNSPISDNKYKTRIDVDASDITDFHNLVLDETFYDLTISSDSLPFNNFLDTYSYGDRIGFDLSGFLYHDYNINPREWIDLQNILSPGYYGADNETTTDVDNLLTMGFVEGLTAQFGTNDEKTALIGFKLDKADLSVWSPILSVLRNAVLSGTMDFDYFVAYADYFIHQQEISCNIKDMNLSALVNGPLFANNSSAFESGFVNISNFNLDFIANEEVTQDCTPDAYNPSDYLKI